MDYVERRMEEEAAKPTTPETSTPFLTPLNIILFTLLLYTLWTWTRPQRATALPPTPAPTVFKTYTPLTLLPYNGENGKPIYFAVNGRVFDVSNGRNFYGPGGPYANFAGRDASRGLAFGSFDEDMLTADLEGPLDGLKDLDAEQREALRGWEERFEEKYLIVGRLVACGEEGK